MNTDESPKDEAPSSDRFKRIQKELVDRYIILRTANQHLERLHYKHVDRLAATDVFIEKAQQKLTNRARWFFVFGALAAIATLSVLIFGINFVSGFSFKAARDDIGGFDNLTTTLLILRGTTITAYILGAAYVCFTFAKALFHEGTNSLNRRHALRFGRLYVYLTDGEIKFEELERAFNWNIENTTAFKDINTDVITKTLFAKLVDAPAEFIRALRQARRKS